MDFDFIPSTEAPTPDSTESKLDFTNRLRNEGRLTGTDRLGAFNLRKDKIRLEVRTRGWGPRSAKEEAWRRAMLEFPPLVTKPKPEAKDGKEFEDQSELDALLARAGTGNSLRDDVQWAYEQANLVIRQRPSSPSLFRWAKATSPPPGPGAIAYIRMADSNPAKFFGEIVPKVLGKVDETVGEEEIPIRDQRTIDKMQGVLDRLVSTQS